MVKKNGVTGSKPEWKWIQPVPGIPDIGGDISAMFKAEGSEPPTALKPLFPRFDDSSLTAAMFAREAIANSWDAYWYSDHTHQDFELHFRFRTLDPLESIALRRALDLDALGNRIKECASNRSAARRSLGLRSNDCLDDLTRPIRVLEVTERWGGGMGGSWDRSDSSMEVALIKVGWAQRREGAGGSFGYGKAAVAQASKILSVIAYSCFPGDSDDPVTRRLLGAAYWKQHEVEDEKFNGWAIFGDQSDRAPRPLEDAHADEVAMRLGLDVRDAEHSESRGSTLLIVDPVFDAAELKAAILCNWWPALQHLDDWKMHLFIAEENGEPEEVIVGEDHEILGSFVSSYLAAVDALREPADGRAIEAGDGVGSPITHEIKREDQTVASLGLFALPPDVAKGMSLVATMRMHRMIISYEEVGSGFPVIRGALVADDEVNESLRMTEPPEHQKWLQKRVGDNRGESEDYQLVRLIIARLKEIAGEMRRDLTPKVEARRGWTPGFSGFLGVPGEAKKGGKPKNKDDDDDEDRTRPKRVVYVHLVHPETFADVEQRPARRPGQEPNTLQASATVEFAISDPDENPQLEVEFQLSGRVVEESGKGELLPIEVEPVKDSAGITELENGLDGTARFRGSLRKGKPVRFNVITNEYSDEWTIDLTFNAVVQAKSEGK